MRTGGGEPSLAAERAHENDSVATIDRDE